MYFWFNTYLVRYLKLKYVAFFVFFFWDFLMITECIAFSVIATSSCLLKWYSDAIWRLTQNVTIACDLTSCFSNILSVSHVSAKSIFVRVGTSHYHYIHHLSFSPFILWFIGVEMEKVCRLTREWLENKMSKVFIHCNQLTHCFWISRYHNSCLAYSSKTT